MVTSGAITNRVDRMERKGLYRYITQVTDSPRPATAGQRIGEQGRRLARAAVISGY
jgi:hypothetical protein